MESFIETAWTLAQMLMVIVATGLFYKAFKWAEKA